MKPLVCPTMPETRDFLDLLFDGPTPGRHRAGTPNGAGLLARFVVVAAGLFGAMCLVAAALTWYGSIAAHPTIEPTVTATTLSAQPSAAGVAGAVTLAATETAADGSHPAGYIQFQVGGTDVGAPVAVSSTGVATTTISALSGLSSGSVSAAFTPMSTAYLASATSAATPELSGLGHSFAVPISVTVPVAGNFTVTVTPGTITLRGTGHLASGKLQDITVTDSRTNSPGWSVVGQSSDFIGTGKAARHTIPGTQLGWVPTGTVTDGVRLGPAVAAGNPGLGSAGSILALPQPGPGLGAQTLGAELILQIPSGTGAGPYTGSLTITYLETAPETAPAGLQLPPAQTR